MEGEMIMGFPISLETVRARQELEAVILGMTLHNIIPPLTHKFIFGFGAKVMDGRNEASPDTLYH